MTFLYDGKLNELDLQMAYRIEQNPIIITQNNIYDAAHLLDVSASKLTKYCQKINLSGFKECKYKVTQAVEQQKIIDPKIDIDIRNVIDDEYQYIISLVPQLFAECQKILIISSSDNSALAYCIARKLRAMIHKDVVTYTFEQNYNFEYIESSVLVLVIDESDLISKTNNEWYRQGQNYIHITNFPLVRQPGYYPLPVGNSRSTIPFDVKVLLISNWFKTTSIKKKTM